MLTREELEGKTKEEVVELLKSTNSKYRVAREDEERSILTMDLKMGRYNLEVDKGIVTKVTMG